MDRVLLANGWVALRAYRTAQHSSGASIQPLFPRRPMNRHGQSSAVGTSRGLHHRAPKDILPTWEWGPMHSIGTATDGPCIATTRRLCFQVFLPVRSLIHSFASRSALASPTIRHINSLHLWPTVSGVNISTSGNVTWSIGSSVSSTTTIATVCVVLTWPAFPPHPSPEVDPPRKRKAFVASPLPLRLVLYPR